MNVPLTMRSSTETTRLGKKSKAVVLFGPTAVGKTAMTEKLFSCSAEIINADSVQVYKGLDIGSAKPDEKLRALIPHHLLDIRNPWEQYTAGDFVRDAMALIPEIEERGRIPLITGGTAYYFRQLVYGPADAPKADDEIRAAVRKEIEEKGRDWAYEELKRVDPVSYARIARNDLYRISRALEVYRSSSRPLSSFILPDSPREDVDFVIIGLQRDKKELDERIAMRVDEMFRMGLYDEIRNLMKAGAKQEWPAMKAIGYREFFEAMETGEADMETIREDIIRSTRQYAKRQMTFFRSFSTCRFFHPDDIESIASYLALEGVRLD